MFVVLLSFRESLICDQTKFLFINDKACMIRHTFVLNPFELKKETNKLNMKAFNMITNKNETKSMVEHISCNCKCQFNSTTCNSNKKWNNETCQC